MTTRDEAISLLIDKQAITEVLYRYARGWDRRDEEALFSCFHPEATFRHGGFDGPAREMLTYWLDATRTVRSMTHLITNVMIEVRGGRAVSECHYLAHHRRAATATTGERDWFIKGRYLDTFEQRSGDWKIDRRIGLADFERLVEPADPELSRAPAEDRGGLKPDDPIYGMLASLS